MTYALHETLEVSELTALKTVCLTKSQTMQLLVTDPALKALMQQDVDMSARHLQQLEAILAEVPGGTEEHDEHNR